MCGITGIFYKQREDGPVGSAMVDMCDELFRRGHRAHLRNDGDRLSGSGLPKHDSLHDSHGV